MIRVALLLCAVTLAGGCSDRGAPLVASDVLVKRPLPGMEMSAGYMTLTNNGDLSVTITRVTSPQFESVEMHETIVEDGISRMTRLNELVIHPYGTTALEPGGKHLMLMNPRDELDSVSLRLHSGDSVVLAITTSLAD